MWYVVVYHAGVSYDHREGLAKRVTGGTTWLKLMMTRSFIKLIHNIKHV